MRILLKACSMEITSKYIYPILGFVLTVVFGFLLSRRGKPYSGLLFNVHKLIALGTVVLIGMGIYRLSKVLDLPTLILSLLIVAAASISALFVTGALMSANKGEYRSMKLVHILAPFALVISLGYGAYLVL